MEEKETDTDRLVKALNNVASLGYPIDRLKESIDELTKVLRIDREKSPPNS